MFKFIGIGAALNPKLGNNGAFVKSRDGKSMFMIDCGETTYSRLMAAGLLDGVENITVLVTHLHPDHVGSLGSLIYEMYYRQPFEARVDVLAPNELKLKAYLMTCGLREEHFNCHSVSTVVPTAYKIADDMTVRIKPYQVEHDKRLICFAYDIKFLQDNIYVYYSGDAKEIPATVLEQLLDDRYDYFYQDVSSADYPDNIHLSLKKLNELVTMDARGVVYCMHLDKNFDPDKARELGFKVVECEYN